MQLVFHVRSLLTAVALSAAMLLPIRSIAAAPLRQSFDLRVPSPPTPVRVDGSDRLVYELHLDNYADAALAPNRLDVLDADRPGTPLATWSGAALARRIAIAWRKPTADAPVDIAAGQHAVVYVEVALERGAALPRSLRHRISFDARAAAGTAPATVEGGDVVVRTRAAPTLGPPLRGGPWIAIYDPDAARGHRRVAFAIDGRVRIPARFAIDWMKLGPRGGFARGDATRVDDFFGYGEDVLAVADATVVATRDSIAESATLTDGRHALEDASGNFVSLDLGGGRYAHYEHLKPGSLRVRCGDRVRRGEVLASLGYTGDSTGPHLHFHVSDGDSPLAGEGLPFAIARFDTLGTYPSLQEFGAGKPWPPTAAAQRAHRGELPAAGMVVEFNR